MNLGRKRESWWSGQWTALLYDMGADPDLVTGRTSRRVRVLGMDVSPGEIRGRVRSRELGDGEVVIGLPTFTDQQWDRVMESLSSQALFVARLLVGDLPLEVEQAFAQAGISLLPTNGAELTISCSICPWTPGPCLPVVAAMRYFGEMLQDDPWLLFLARGREQEEILQALRTSRMGEPATLPPAASGLGSSALPAEKRAIYYAYPVGDPMQPESLHLNLNAFWGDSSQLAEIHHHIAPPTIELALLRRLGYPSVSSGSTELYQSLADAYHKVTQAALNLAFTSQLQEEPEEDGWSDE